MAPGLRIQSVPDTALRGLHVSSSECNDKVQMVVLTIKIHYVLLFI